MKTRSLHFAEPGRLFQLLTACHNITSRRSICTMVYPLLKEIVPHTNFLCGIASAHPQSILDSINVGFAAPQLIDQLAINVRTSDSPASHCPEAKSPLYIDEQFLRRKSAPAGSAWPELLQVHGMRNLMVHGVREIHGGATSYFCFSDIGPAIEEIRHLLNLITPHLHAALCSHYTLKDSQAGCGISTREKEILKLVRIGKTNPEIGMILGISAWTVKNHVQNFMAKLEVSTRGHAVVKAMSMGLIVS